MKNDHPSRLQRYFDGELPDAERVTLEASLTDDDRLRLAVMAEMRRALDGVLHAEAADHHVDLWAGIDKQLGGKVVPIRRRRTGVWVASVSIALAAAASLFLMFRRPLPTNGCDVESLDVEGAVASVASAGEPGPHQVTVIWTTEEQ